LSTARMAGVAWLDAETDARPSGRSMFTWRGLPERIKQWRQRVYDILASDMNLIPLPYSFAEPPMRLKKARLDNIALVPASLLPMKGTYQPIANNLPTGSVLCVPGTPGQQKCREGKRTLEGYQKESKPTSWLKVAPSSRRSVRGCLFCSDLICLPLAARRDVQATVLRAAGA
jgi:hypothetical protein